METLTLFGFAIRAGVAAIILLGIAFMLSLVMVVILEWRKGGGF